MTTRDVVGRHAWTYDAPLDEWGGRPLALDDVVRSTTVAARLTFDLPLDDPPPYRTSLVALKHAYHLEAERLRAAVFRSLERELGAAAWAQVRERLGRLCVHDRRFELSVEDVELACGAGGARAVYELWTGESGAWLDAHLGFVESLQRNLAEVQRRTYLPPDLLGTGAASLWGSARPR